MNPQIAVQQLIAAGMSEKSIADHVKCSQPTIHRIKHGAIGSRGPSFELATALIELAKNSAAANDVSPVDGTDAAIPAEDATA